MKKLIKFFLKTGEIKRAKQRGLVLRGIQDPATVGSHSFREALMGWTLARAENTGLDENRLIKLTLCHDLVAGYAGDITPYDLIINKYKGKNLKEMYTKWVRLPQADKKKFYKWQSNQEQKALRKLVADLPKSLAVEMAALWREFREGTSHEGRFIQQLDMLENFLQAVEYWKDDKTFPIESWWQQMKELMADPILVQLLAQIDEHLFKNELRVAKSKKKKR
ncbi:MAG: HD domain-containing protein [bacterium]|nr:HD domain-containing protein [bacterium]